MREERVALIEVAAAILRWWAALTLVALAGLYASGTASSGTMSALGFAETVGSRAWIVFSFVAFVGGLAASGLAASRRREAVVTLSAAGALGAVAYLVGAFVVPVLELEADRSVGIDIEARYPAGPETPLGLMRRQSMILDAPSSEYAFSVERPLQQPPNWLKYLIHQPIALAAFGALNALLGLVVGWTTSGLSPPRRRRVRWFLGIVSAVAFFAAGTVGTTWIRLSPDNSAVVAAWLPLVVPLLGLALAWGILRSSWRRDLHGRRVTNV